MAYNGVEIRCPGSPPNNQLHAVLRDFGEGRKFYEVKCKDKLCGARNGAVVFHYYEAGTGKYSHTKTYKTPKHFTSRQTGEQLNNNTTTSNEVVSTKG